MQLTREEWTDGHPRWAEALEYLLAHALIENERVVEGGHLLVTLSEGILVGVLAGVVQEIGPEMDCPILHDSSGQALTELKIRAFHVQEAYRRQGIGTELQQAALLLAARLGCYQVRSHSNSSALANYAIKQKLGFAAHPGLRRLRERDEPGIYWLKVVSAGE